MLIESTRTRAPHLPAEVCAWCDGERDGKRCEEVGPPVECRTPRRKRDPDFAASSLAVKVSGFFLRCVPAGRRTWTEEVYCRTCAIALLRKLEREHAAEIAAAVSRRGAMAALSVSWSARERVEEMQKLRVYLGIVVPGAEIAADAG
jgi:hypothetical protein